MDIKGLAVTQTCHAEISMTTIGYARVSTDGQTLDAQRDALRAAGAARIYEETASGARTDRLELRRALAALSPGDLLVVTRLDRLARSTRDLLNAVATIGERGAGLRSLADVWADTTTPHGRLMITVLAGLAEFERELILARTSEGRARAVARGQHMGRRPVLTPHQVEEIRARYRGGESTRELGRSYGVSHATVARVVG